MGLGNAELKLGSTYFEIPSPQNNKPEQFRSGLFLFAGSRPPRRILFLTFRADLT